MQTEYIPNMETAQVVAAEVVAAEVVAAEAVAAEAVGDPRDVQARDEVCRIRKVAAV